MGTIPGAVGGMALWMSIERTVRQAAAILPVINTTHSRPNRPARSSIRKNYTIKNLDKITVGVLEYKKEGKMRRFSNAVILFLTLMLISGTSTGIYANQDSREASILTIMHSISSNTLFGYVKELCKDKYGGRLTGTKGYNMAANWVISHYKKWGLEPAGDNGTYLQAFKNPYTLILPGDEAYLHIPIDKKGHEILKHYRLEKDFIPGSTSDTGEVTAEVVYVGYGITAPELGYDDYKGVDVKGKIVLMEREVPISPEENPEEFKKWRPYSFHQYKVENAWKHGAAGMLYNYHITNPNCKFIKGFVLTYIGKEILNDLFTGAKVSHKEVVKRIRKTRKPYSFSLGKIMTIKNFTEHHPEGVAYNVLAMVEGTDPVLKNEVIVVSAHLDHVGRNPLLVPGANDNASGVSVVMGVAKAIAESPVKPKRTVLFALFGAEEQGVKGSEYFVKHLPDSLSGKKIVACFNSDGVGRGDKIYALAAKNYPELWNRIKRANEKYVHRVIKPAYFLNIARPRLDAAHFMWAGVPTLSFSAFGMPLKFDVYHKSLDKPKYLTPEIMEDLARILYLTLLEM